MGAPGVAIALGRQEAKNGLMVTWRHFGFGNLGNTNGEGRQILGKLYPFSAKCICGLQSASQA